MFNKEQKNNIAKIFGVNHCHEYYKTISRT